MKIFCTILIFFTFCFGYAANAQTGKLQIRIEILPELKDIFINTEIQIDILDTISRKNRFVKNNEAIVFDSLQEGSIGIMLVSHIKDADFERAYYLSVDDIEITNGSLKSITILFPKNCGYNRRGRNNKCPSCKKSDKVIPISYGLPVPLYDEQGNIIKEPKHYSAGCDVSDCDPGWYCERNKLKF